MKKLSLIYFLILSFAGFSQMTHVIDTSSVSTDTSLESPDLFTFEIPNHSIGYIEVLILAKDQNDSVLIEKKYAAWSEYSILKTGNLLTPISAASNAGYSVFFGTEDSMLVISITAPTIEKTMRWYCLVNIYYNDAVVTAAMPPPPAGGNSLNLLAANTEYLSRATDKVLTGEFSVQITCQDLVQNGTYIPLFGGTTTANRLLLDAGASKVALNIGGSSLIIKSVPGLDVVAKNTYKLYRTSANDVYFQVDAETPIFMLNSANNLTLRYIGKASSTFKITGRIHDFTIGADEFLLTEGTGTTLTSVNTLSTWTINSTIAQPHIDDIVWSVAPPESAAIQVINAGVGGNNAQDMDNRFATDVTPHAPDLVFICPGTNDALNSFHNLTPAIFKTKLTSIVQKTLAIGAVPVVWNILPTIDSYSKADHDYTAIYGPENTYDLNDILDSLFRTKVAEVVSENPGCLMFDVKSVITDYSTAQTSYLQNEANTITGNTDGIHLTGTHAATINNGRLAVATAMAMMCDSYEKIVLLGDSNMAMGGATSVAIYLSLELNN